MLYGTESGEGSLKTGVRDCMGVPWLHTASVLQYDISSPSLYVGMVSVFCHLEELVVVVEDAVNLLAGQMDVL
jgi:hypothetical protein